MTYKKICGIEEGAKLLDSDKNAKLITTFQCLSREKSMGFSCEINRIAREDVALQCFEEGARGKSGGFLV